MPEHLVTYPAGTLAKLVGEGKWTVSTTPRYMETILSQRKYPLKTYFSFYKNTKEYKTLTIITIFKAVQSIRNFKNHKFIISVDALGEKEKMF